MESSRDPGWICNRCGKLANAAHANYYGSCPRASISTFHTGICGMCGREVPVTEERDYGYPDLDLVNWKHVKELDKAYIEAGRENDLDR